MSVAANEPLVYSPSDDPEVVARRKAVREEYGQLVASQDIRVGEALAYRMGDPVPVSNSDLYGYEARGMAVRRDSEQGRQVLAAVAGSSAGPVDTAAAVRALAMASADEVAPLPKPASAARRKAMTSTKGGDA